MAIKIPTISLSDISHIYKTRTSKKDSFVEALIRPLNMNINDSFSVLIGPNGSGKTTLLSIIGGQKTPTTGNVKLQIDNSSKNYVIDVKKNSTLAKKYILFTFQEALFDERFSISKQLILHGIIYGFPREIIKKRIKEYLLVFNLWEKRNKRIWQLSGGQKKQIEMIRGFIIDPLSKYIKDSPKWFIADEPTAYCDVSAKRKIWDLLLERQEQGMSILLATNLLEEAESLGSFVFFLKQGKIISEGSAESIKKRFTKAPGIQVSCEDEITQKNLYDLLSNSYNFPQSYWLVEKLNHAGLKILSVDNQLTSAQIMHDVLEIAYKNKIELKKVEKYQISLEELLLTI